jgi:hypothetical protein
MCRGRIKKRNGIALIICIVFLAIFSALVVGMVGMSDTNAQLARNQHQANLALTGAQSGLEIMRYWLKNVEVSMADTDKMSTVAWILQQRLNNAGVTNISVVYNSALQTVTIPIVSLDGTNGQSFGAEISLDPTVDPNKAHAKITGSCGLASKQVVVDINFVTLGNQIFDYGVATKGPLSLTGQANIGSQDLAIYGSVYIEGYNTIGDTLTMSSRTSIIGDVSIANPYATYSVSGSIAGENGSNVDDHIHIGVPEVDFPTPHPENFLKYATGAEITGDVSTPHQTFDNCIIRSGQTVVFGDDATINGVLYIEAGANVQFSGKVTVNGVIAGDGPLNNEDGTSSLIFSGQVISNDMSTLTDPKFDAVKTQTGTFICAPGFSIQFTGQSLQVTGAIAGNGISFGGQTAGNIDGSVIDYSDETMTMLGQSVLTFNRSGRTGRPAGFEPDQRLDFIPDSYSEPAPSI